MKTLFEFRLKGVTIATLHNYKIAKAFRVWLNENGFYKVRTFIYNG